MKLEAKILRGLQSGAQIDFTVRNLARSFTVNERRVRRTLKRLQGEGHVVQHLQPKSGKSSVPAVWMVAP